MGPAKMYCKKKKFKKKKTWSLSPRGGKQKTEETGTTSLYSCLTLFPTHLEKAFSLFPVTEPGLKKVP